MDGDDLRKPYPLEVGSSPWKWPNDDGYGYVYLDLPLTPGSGGRKKKDEEIFLFDPIVVVFDELPAIMPCPRRWAFWDEGQGGNMLKRARPLE